MCTKPKVSSDYEPEVVKAATQADASTQKSDAANRIGSKNFISENVKTSNNGLTDEVNVSKKKLLGE